MDKKQKIEWLQRYRWIEQENERLAEEIQRCRSRAEGFGQAFSDSPGGGPGCDVNALPRAVEALLELENELAAMLRCGVNTRRQIEKAIRGIQDDRLQLLLRYRYIDGMTWEHTAEKMHLDNRWAYRLHDKAIHGLTIESQ